MTFINNKSLEFRRAIFLDISKAFDKGWHDGLIFKMRRNGVSGQLLKLFLNYFNNRKQRVILNGFPADYSTIEPGVPQGSALSPLLFLIYINNLERNIKYNIIFCWWYHALLYTKQSCNIWKWIVSSFKNHKSWGLSMEDGVQPWSK